MKKLLFISFSLLGLLTPVFGQITVNNAQSPNSLVQNVLLGTGVTATNITYNGNALNAQNPQSNVTFFNAQNTTFPISSGVILSTGAGTVAVGPNSAGGLSNNAGTTIVNDPDLNAIANGAVTNGAILEFDFIPSGDTVSFRYMFASEEYPEFAPPNNAGFNDAFGFFLSGAGFAGPYTNGAVNIARVPNTTTPVTINNVNPAVNSAYYVNNLGGAAYGTAIQYDGTTVVLTATAQVVCGQTYHIKLCIGNVADQGWDSGVFIEADSFTSPAVEVSVATVTGDTTVVEGCTSAQFIFVRGSNLIGDSLEVDYDLAGTATMGVDYNNLPNPVYFVPGEDTVILTLTPIDDGIIDAPEYVTITATTVTECGDTIVSTGTLYILDVPFINLHENDPTVLCANNAVVGSVNPTGGLPPYTYSWSYGGQTGSTANLPITDPGSIDYLVTATDACGFSATDTVTVTLDPLLIDSLQSTPSSSCLPTGSVAGFYSGNVGPAIVSWTGPGMPGANNSSTSTMNNLPPGDYYFIVENSGCQVIDVVFIDVMPDPILDVNANDITIACPTDSALVTVSTATGTAPFTYVWSYMAQTGDTAYVPNLVNGSSVDYYVYATDACGFVGMDTLTVYLNQTLMIDTIYMFPATACNPDGAVSGVVSGLTGQPLYHFSGPGIPGSFQIDASVLQDIPSGWYYFTVEDDVCFASDSVFVTQENPPIAEFTPSVTSGCSPLNVTFTNTSQNADTYQWTFGNGQSTTVTNLGDQSQTYTSAATVQLVVFQGNCTDTATAAISISICGCTDPAALNFDPSANQNDGSCTYPVPPMPTVEAPNVFTPGPDGINSVFELKTTNAENVKLTIMNRWGNTVFEGSGANPTWDGTTNGTEVAEGVYFYKYEVTGVGGANKLEGHGFVHVER